MDYTDGRYDSPSDNLKANLGRMPVIAVGDETVGQSLAIYYYLAADNNLMGDSLLESAQILSVLEHVREMNLAYRTLIPANTEPSQEARDKWFDGGSKDVLGTADSSARSTRYLHWWMGRIEQALDTDGFAIGSRLSVADIVLHYAFAETLRDEDATEGSPKWAREPFTDNSRVSAALERYPRLLSSVTKVAQNENFQKWIATRGLQKF